MHLLHSPIGFPSFNSAQGSSPSAALFAGPISPTKFPTVARLYVCIDHRHWTAASLQQHVSLVHVHSLYDKPVIWCYY